MQYKKAPKRISEIGKELNVGTLVEGSVRKAANKVRITVQLIDARNEGHIWAQNYDKQLDDIFTIQSEVAQKVAENLKVQLLESKMKKIQKGATQSQEAYTLYLKGLFYWNKRTPEAVKKAAESFKQAVAIDPMFALGYAGLANVYQVTAANYYDDPMVYYPKAKEFALKALSIDDDLAEAHTVLGAHLIGYDHDFGRGEQEFKRAIELNPNYPTVYQWYSHLLHWEGRHSEATAAISKALELSPLSLIINTNLIDSYYYLGEYDKGIELGRRLLEMDPTFATTYASLTVCYIKKGMWKEAEECVETGSKYVEEGERVVWNAYLLAAMGRKEESKRMLDEVAGSYEKNHVTPYFIALIYFVLGDPDSGFHYLEAAYASRDRSVLSLAADVDIAPYRSDPRYGALLDKLGIRRYLTQS